VFLVQLRLDHLPNELGHSEVLQLEPAARVERKNHLVFGFRGLGNGVSVCVGFLLVEVGVQHEVGERDQQTLTPDPEIGVAQPEGQEVVAYAEHELPLLHVLNGLVLPCLEFEQVAGLHRLTQYLVDALHQRPELEVSPRRVRNQDPLHDQICDSQLHVNERYFVEAVAQDQDERVQQLDLLEYLGHVHQHGQELLVHTVDLWVAGQGVALGLQCDQETHHDPYVEQNLETVLHQNKLEHPVVQLTAIHHQSSEHLQRYQLHDHHRYEVAKRHWSDQFGDLTESSHIRELPLHSLLHLD